MSQDCHQLALDDIVHLMSPSPAPQSPLDDSDVPPRINSASPDPLPESDIVQMRRMVNEMRHLDRPDSQLTPREKELAQMVHRLTSMARPDPDQLLRQAETISALIQQRDLLLHQAEEQRLRWNSEKDGWARMAEALLAQQGKNRLDLERDEDIERLRAAEIDNKGLRQRLNESQSRLQILESELTRLRPLLLMQPLISRPSMPPPTPNPKTQYARRRKKDAATTENEEHGASEDEPSTDHLETPSHSQATPRVKYRKSDAPNDTHPIAHSNKRRPQKAIRGLSADARVEHLFLAARKIGKHRAGIVSGMVQQLDERERRREESAMTAVATPKTPKRNTTHTSYPPEGSYVYMGGQVRPGPGIQPVPLFFPTYPHHLLQTPSSSTTAPSATSSTQKAKQDVRSNYPPTPLDSLLSAARTMMTEDDDVEDEDEEIDVVGDSPGNTAGARSARHRNTLGSPVPKRRKVSSRPVNPTASHELTSGSTVNGSTNSVDTSGAKDTGHGRVRSALDVLADQAAAFSTQEQSVAASQTETQTRDKGKEKAGTRPRESSGSTPKPRGKIKSRKECEAVVPSSALSASRSLTSRSDLGDNPFGPGSSTVAGGSAPEVALNPGGMGDTGTSNPSSSRTLPSDGDQAATNDGAENPQLPATPSQQTEDSGGLTPRQGSHIQVSSIPENEIRETLPSQRSETAPIGAENDGSSAAKNKELMRVAEQNVSVTTTPAKRPRSPYVKWSKEEDDLLAQAVAKYGQKWDLVQKALPSRGYHQVRQRWLRKLGVFDSKPDLSSFQTAATTFPSVSQDSGEPRGNPKLGLAPLSSEKAFSGLARKSPSMPP